MRLVTGSRALLIATLLVPALARADQRQALGGGTELVFTEQKAHQRGIPRRLQASADR